MRDRSWRRKQNDRIASKRRRQMKAIVNVRTRMGGERLDWELPDGRLVVQSPFGCPRGRHCSVCHPGKTPRELTPQEMRAQEVDCG